MKRRIIMCLLVAGLSFGLSACGAQTQTPEAAEENTIKENVIEETTADFSTLTCTGSMELKYATGFSVDEYGEYRLITIQGEDKFLLVPDNAPVPEKVSADVTVLKQPLDKTYLVSSTVMDLLVSIDALDNIRLSGTKVSDYCIEEAIEAMEKGDILFAGKYSEPDYELIISEGCNFTIENTMIEHKPEVKEKIEELGIPVMVERSSYESHPLGRFEWIKLYGVLYNSEDEATLFYNEKCAAVEAIMQKEVNGKSVAFFYVTSNGAVNVRKPNDYVAKMIELAGGKYALSDYLVEEENALSTFNMQMEDFYAAAHDADIIIYNSTIDGGLKSVDELLEKSSLFADFKAVQEEKVYCTTQNFFQETSGIAEFIEDVNDICVSSDKEEGFHYLNKLR